MSRAMLAAVAVSVTALSFQTVEAKTLEDVLKEKGVITEADYKEVTRVKRVDYKLGKGTTFTSPDEKFQLSMGGRLQARYTYTEFDAPASRDFSRPEVRRMKFFMSGYAYTKNLTYQLQIDVVNGDSVRLLEHAYFNYKLLDEGQLLVGQTKVPFGRQWLNSSGAQQFVDRSAASDFFRPGYDAGVKVHGDVLKGLATYELGGYGGAGQTTTRGTTDNAYAARVTVNPFGKMPYNEADVDLTEKPLLSVGANYYNNTLRKDTATAFEGNQVQLTNTNTAFLGRNIGRFGILERVDMELYGADAAFKWMGAYAQAEYLAGSAEGRSSGAKAHGRGFYAQAGYCIIPKTFEAALRYSYIDPTREATNDHQTDIGGALSWYINKHNLKLQGDVTNSHTQRSAAPGTTDDMIYRLQAQVIF